MTKIISITLFVAMIVGSIFFWQQNKNGNIKNEAQVISSANNLRIRAGTAVPFSDLQESVSFSVSSIPGEHNLDRSQLSQNSILIFSRSRTDGLVKIIGCDTLLLEYKRSGSAGNTITVIPDPDLFKKKNITPTTDIEVAKKIQKTGCAQQALLLGTLIEGVTLSDSPEDLNARVFTDKRNNRLHLSPSGTRDIEFEGSQGPAVKFLDLISEDMLRIGESRNVSLQFKNINMKLNEDWQAQLFIDTGRAYVPISNPLSLAGRVADGQLVSLTMGVTIPSTYRGNVFGKPVTISLRSGEYPVIIKVVDVQSGKTKLQKKAPANIILKK